MPTAGSTCDGRVPSGGKVETGSSGFFGRLSKIRPVVIAVQSKPRTAQARRVAGTWSYEKGRVKTKPFGRLDPATKRELRAEADRLATLRS
jgi:hypothetical protein